MLQHRKPITVSHFQIGRDKCGVGVIGSVGKLALTHQVSYCLRAATDDLNSVLYGNRVKSLANKNLVVGVVLNHQDGSIILHHSPLWSLHSVTIMASG